MAVCREEDERGFIPAIAGPVVLQSLAFEAGTPVEFLGNSARVRPLARYRPTLV